MACGTGNSAASDECARCGCPAVATVAQLRVARRKLGIPSDLEGPSLADALRRIDSAAFRAVNGEDRRPRSVSEVLFNVATIVLSVFVLITSCA